MTDCRNLIYFTRFDPSVDRGGGSRRMLQVLELLDADRVEVVSSARRDWLDDGEGRETDRPDAADLLYRILSTSGEHLLWSMSRRDGAWRLRRTSDLWARRMEERPAPGLVIMDDPVYFPGLTAKLLRSSVPLVAVCHNIESLVPSNTAAPFRGWLRRKESNLLRRCRLVLTIAEEETKALEGMGVNARYLPTHPPAEVRGALLDVRARRQGEGQGILLLGSALNEETKQGMEAVISFWRTSGIERTGERLIVAGYGTDRHFYGLPREGPVAFLGPLGTEELRGLLATVRGAVCYQTSGGGALTRIAELLVAGVPVLANEHAARSYGSPPGLIRFGSLQDLPEALERLSAVTEVQAPARPAIPDELRLLLESATEAPCRP